MRKRRRFLGFLSAGFVPSGIEWLFRDEFITDDAAPISSPRTAEPGPGTLTVVDTDNKSSISSAALQLATHTTPALGDPRLYTTDTFARALGRAVLSTGNRAGASRYLTGWGEEDATPYQHSFYWNNNVFTITELATFYVVGTTAYFTDYQTAIPLRNSGAYFFIKGGTFTEWTLVWPGNTDVTSPLNGVLTASDGGTSVFTADYLRVADLPAPFDVDVLHLRDTVIGFTDTFTHPERCVIEFDLDTLTTAASMQINFRQLDGSNKWFLAIASDGDIILWERILGASTNKGSASAVFSSGDRIEIGIDTDNIWVKSNGVFAFNSPLADTLQSYTDGEIASVGDGAISDLDIYEIGESVVTYEDATPTASDTFTHDADTRVQFTVDTIPSAGEIIVIVRSEDATHNWRVEIDSDGDLDLVEDNAGDTTRINAVQGLTGGEVIKAEFIGNTITLWNDATQAGTYSTAHGSAGVLTATDGEFDSLGTAGAASNLTVTSLARQVPPGIATQGVLGFITEGQVFVTEADFVEEFFLNALPSGGSISHIFRKQDATHNWRVDINAAGDLDLIEDDAGDTNRINDAAGLSGGERIMVVADDETITLYRDNTQAGTYSSAANFKTETDGEWNSMGTAGLVSNHIIDPRTLSGAAKTVLNKYSA